MLNVCINRDKEHNHNLSDCVYMVLNMFLEPRSKALVIVHFLSAFALMGVSLKTRFKGPRLRSSAM